MAKYAAVQEAVRQTSERNSALKRAIVKRFEMKNSESFATNVKIELAAVTGIRKKK